MKNILSLLVLLFQFIFVSAQDDLNTKLPIDPKIRTGVLPNGMHYYIRKNAKPEKRAEFRLAVDAGSTSENDDQQGLAHLTEHMAFNGTKNFKKNDLIDYLESVGTKFGPHLNAYTSFDETVYMIQLPTDTPAIVDKGLQILEDWSHNLLFDSVEVEKERGVVVEEWRLGQGADERMRRKYWPIFFKDSRYAVRLPIGKKEIIEGCKQSTLRAFYNDWYRPDLMAIIAVGDFDLDDMTAKIKKQFSGVPVKKDPRPIQSFSVPDNKEPSIAITTDKEARMSRINLYYKQPVEIQKTVGDYRTGIAENLFSGMLNDRMDEILHQPDPPFIYSYSYYGDLVRTKYAYTSSAGCKEDGIERALQTIVTENERVHRFGFTATELKRQKASMMSQMDKTYADRDKTESGNFAREIVSNFLTQEPMPGIEYEYNLYKKYLDGITLEEVNSFSKKWITGGENCIVLITAPEKPTTKIPDEKRIREIISGMQKLDLKPYNDAVNDKPLVEGKLTGSTISSTNTIGDFGLTEWKLSNGVRILVKPTDFKNDEILFTSYSWGGWSLYPDKDFLSASRADEIMDESGIGSFNATTLQKALSGKIVSCSPYISDIMQGFNGSCSTRDLETMMQLIYEYFTDPRKDMDEFKSYLEKQKGVLQNKNSDPQSIFSDTVRYAMSGYNYRYSPMTVDKLKEINLDRAYDVYKDRFSDASGFTFVFVGNFNIDSLKILAQKYIGSLPSSGKHESWKDLGIRYPSGKVENTVVKGQAPRSTVMMRFNMPFEFNRNHRNEVNALMKLVNIRLREVLREDKSGVYGVNCSANPKHFPYENLELVTYFSCAPDNVDMLITAAQGVFQEIREKGADDKNLLKIRELSLREREVGLKENQFWLSSLSANYQNGEDIMDLKKYNDWVNNLKGEDFKVFASRYLNDKNYAKFVLVPEK